MIDRIPRSQIQLATLQAAHAELERRAAGDFTHVSPAERQDFVQSVQGAIPGMPAEAVRDVLQAEWSKGNESLLATLQASKLQAILGGGSPSSAAPRPDASAEGVHSPLGLRLQAATDPRPFWQKTTAEGPYAPPAPAKSE